MEHFVKMTPSRPYTICPAGTGTSPVLVEWEGPLVRTDRARRSEGHMCMAELRGSHHTLPCRRAVPQHITDDDHVLTVSQGMSH